MPRDAEGQREVIYLFKDPGDAGGGVYLDQPPCLACGHWMQRELVPGGEMLTCIGPTGCGQRFWLDRWPYEPLERAQGGSPK